MTMTRKKAFDLGRSMPDAFVEIIDDDENDEPVILAGARFELDPEDVFWFEAGQQASDDPADDAGATVYCSEDDYEAVCFTQMGTPLCEYDRQTYELGQLHAFNDINSHRSVAHNPVYKMGDASPDGAIYGLDDVRFTRKTWKYSIVAVSDDKTGEWRKP